MPLSTHLDENHHISGRRWRGRERYVEAVTSNYAAALIGVGVWGALAQQTFVMLMMGIELMLNGVILAVGGFWAYTGGGLPKGQVLVIITMAVMAIEMAIGFALVAAVFRARQADMTEGIGSLKG